MERTTCKSKTSNQWCRFCGDNRLRASKYLHTATCPQEKSNCLPLHETCTYNMCMFVRTCRSLMHTLLIVNFLQIPRWINVMGIAEYKYQLRPVSQNRFLVSNRFLKRWKNQYFVAVRVYFTLLDHTARLTYISVTTVIDTDCQIICPIACFLMFVALNSWNKNIT